MAARLSKVPSDKRTPRIGVRRPETRVVRRRPTDHLTLDRARTLSEAANMARRIGLEFTHLVTIHWACAASATIPPFERQALFLERFRKWAGRRGFTPTFAWVRERQASPIEHLHLMVHLPRGAGAAFERAALGWIKREADDPGAIEPRVLDISRIKDGTQWIVGRYLLKGGDALVRKTYGVRGRPAQGRIQGKRLGVSRNLDRSARARFYDEASEQPSNPKDFG